jgi:hypothetical protein
VVSLEANEELESFNIASLVGTPQRQYEGIGRLLLAAALGECGSAETTVSTGVRNNLRYYFMPSAGSSNTGVMLSAQNSSSWSSFAASALTFP